MIRAIYRATIPEQTDGRGPGTVVGHFLKDADAVAAVKGMGTMGCGNGTTDVITVWESLDEYIDQASHPHAKYLARQRDAAEYETYLRLKDKFS